MKPKGFRTRKRWEWENGKRIAIFSADGVKNEVKKDVINCAGNLLREFAIPLEILDGNLDLKKDETLVVRLLAASLTGYEIDYEKFLGDLLQERIKSELAYALILIIDRSMFRFKKDPHSDPAIYGVGFDEGLVILRHTKSAAVRHEVAHMLGLRHHHPKTNDCIMNWDAALDRFCDECRREITAIWSEEIAAGGMRPESF